MPALLPAGNCSDGYGHKPSSEASGELNWHVQTRQCFAECIPNSSNLGSPHSIM